jgi:hypothetical protein
VGHRRGGAGLPSPPTAGLAAALTPVARAIVEPLRGYGAYAAALLRYLGRSAE